MKIICCADTHIGYKNYSCINKETGITERELQTINLLNETIDYAINNNADAYIFAGDMYKNNTPQPSLIDYVNKAFNKLSINNITTLILDGNHDVSKMDQMSSGLKQFETLNISNIIQTRFERIEIINNIRFVFLPTHHTRDQIEDIINNLDDTYPTIIIGHLAINHAQLNDWNIIEKEECIPVEIFNKPFIKAVVLGHLHKHQILNKNPLVFYVGSTNRIDFSEEKQTKGFVELDIDDNYNIELTFHELDAQKFFTINYKGETNCTQEVLTLITKNKKQVKNAIVRVRMDIPREENIDEKTIIKTILDNQAQYVLKIQRFDSREINISQDQSFYATDVYAAIDQYLINDKRKDIRAQLAKEIVKYVNTTSEVI